MIFSTLGEVTPLGVPLPTALEFSAISVIAMLFLVNWLTGPERSRCNAGRLEQFLSFHLLFTFLP